MNRLVIKNNSSPIVEGALATKEIKTNCNEDKIKIEFANSTHLGFLLLSRPKTTEMEAIIKE